MANHQSPDGSTPPCPAAAPRWQGPELRWGAGERADVGMARERLLDAARFCYERLGLVSTSMADIAAQAKVTRPTVYRYFKSRQEVMHAVLQRELDGFWRRLETELAEIDHFGDYLIEALLYLLRSAATDGSARFLFAPATLSHLQELLLAEVLAPGTFHHPIYTHALRPGSRPPAELSVAVEWFNRLALSYLSRPGTCSSEEQLRDLLAGLCPWAQRHDQPDAAAG
jgi:AcrR family transcriptional regulator